MNSYNAIHVFRVITNQTVSHSGVAVACEAWRYAVCFRVPVFHIFDPFIKCIHAKNIVRYNLINHKHPFIFSFIRKGNLFFFDHYFYIRLRYLSLATCHMCFYSTCINIERIDEIV